MTVAHSSLTGSSLHENKGVASASDNTVATASGGTTVWKKLGVNNFDNTITPFASSVLHIVDKRVSGNCTPGPSINTWIARVLNTVVTNEITGASLASNTITLPVGTYWVEAYAPCYDCGGTKTRFRNTSDSVSEIVSINSQFDGHGGVVVLVGPLTVSGSSKNFQLQQYVKDTANDNTTTLGAASGTGEGEIYATIFIYKLT